MRRHTAVQHAAFRLHQTAPLHHGGPRGCCYITTQLLPLSRFFDDEERLRAFS